MVSWSRPTSASRFSVTISAHIAGFPAATRVVSRNPPPPKRPSPGSFRQTRAALAATRCGRWLIRATSSSWIAALIQEVRQPMVFQNRSSAAACSGGAPSSLVSRQAAFLKRVEVTAARPLRSEPAIGWLPMKRMSRPCEQRGDFPVRDALHAADVGDQAAVGQSRLQARR